MDVEDLIASMHVGKEGYELKALQAHLSKTLNYNPETTTYQPVQGVHYIPPPPVSSLNSMASTSYGTSYHQYPTHPNLAINQGRAVRPQCTPMHSFRGFQPVMAEEGEEEEENAMDTEMDGVEETNRSHRNQGNNGLAQHLDHHRLPSPRNNHDEGDFAAFSSDAFAPIYANDPSSPKFSNGKSPDRWSAFKVHPHDQGGDSQANNSQAFRGLSTSPTWTLDSHGRDRATPVHGHFGVPPPPEDEPIDSAGDWSGGRLRNTNAREQRKLHGDTLGRRK